VRRTSWLLGLVFVAQVGSCKVAPTAVLAPAIAVFDGCNTWARPDPLSLRATVWCGPSEQGDREPSGWLAIAALGVLVASTCVWIWPGAMLLARFQDKITGDAR
jgi:hypothetical protein